MLNKEIIEKVESIVRHLQDTSEYAEYIGVRFENRLLKVGDECGVSKDNRNRVDCREFPEYGTKEYENLPELEGVSAYDAEIWQHHILDAGETTNTDDYHLYVIEGDGIDRESGEDEDEVIIMNAEVMAVIF